MGTTTRLALPYPGAGDSPQGNAQIQALAEALDNAAIVTRGAYASRPAHGGIVGRLYQQTDAGGGYPAGTYSVTNGSGWEVLALGSDTAAALLGSGGTTPTAANPFLTEDDAGVMHVDKARTVTSVHTYDAAPKHAVQAFTDSGSISATGGHTVTFAGASGKTLTMPAASVGMEFDVYNIDTADAVSVARAGSDTINGATSITLGPGDHAKFVCIAAGDWRCIPTWFPWAASMNVANSGAPTSTANGTWQKVGSGGGVVTWTNAYDFRPSGATAQVDTATNKRLDVRRSGLYLVTGKVRFSSLSAGVVAGCGVSVNGTLLLLDYEHIGSAGGSPHVSVSEILELSAGDYLELRSFQNDSTSEPYFINDSVYDNRLSMRYMGPDA